MRVEMASTAMEACASRVLLGRSRRMIRAAVICAWHSAQTSTAPTVCRVRCVQTVPSLLTRGLAVLRVRTVQLVWTVSVSLASPHSNLASTGPHALRYVIGVCPARTLPCSTLLVVGCLQTVLCVSLVRLAGRLPRPMCYVRYVHQASTRRSVSAAAIARWEKSRMWLSLVLGLRIALLVSMEHTVITMALQTE